MITKHAVAILKKRFGIDVNTEPSSNVGPMTEELKKLLEEFGLLNEEEDLRAEEPNSDGAVAE